MKQTCIANVDLFMTYFRHLGISLWNKNAHDVASALVLLPSVAEEISSSLYKSSTKSQQTSLTKSEIRSRFSSSFSPRLKRAPSVDLADTKNKMVCMILV